MLHCSVVPDVVEGRRNASLWWGFFLALASMLCNAALFLSPPGQGALPWLSILLAALALIFLAMGLKPAFGADGGRGGKARSSIVAVVSLLLVGLAVLISFESRGIPASVEAPQVGQKAPEFTLLDTRDQPVSLAELFASTANDPPPKAVLLVFYRGYW